MNVKVIHARMEELAPIRSIIMCVVVRMGTMAHIVRVSKAYFPLGEVFRTKRNFSSSRMRSLIPTGATFLPAAFLSTKK